MSGNTQPDFPPSDFEQFRRCSVYIRQWIESSPWRNTVFYVFNRLLSLNEVGGRRVLAAGGRFFMDVLPR